MLLVVLQAIVAVLQRILYVVEQQPVVVTQTTQYVVSQGRLRLTAALQVTQFAWVAANVGALTQKHRQLPER